MTDIEKRVKDLEAAVKVYAAKLDKLVAFLEKGGLVPPL